MHPGWQDGSPGESPSGASPLPERPSYTFCPSCGKPGPVNSQTNHCPWCEQSRQWREKSNAARRTAAEDEHTFTRLMWAFALMLLTNVILSFALPTIDPRRPITEDEARTCLTSLTIAELSDFVIVGVCLLASRKFLAAPDEASRNPRLAWIAALPLLAVLLVINYGYHALLLWLSGAEPILDRLAESGYYPWWQLATDCLQPAVVEELFFRGVVFGWLCRAVGPGNAIFASSSMFAAAHTGGLASFPVLFLVGAGLAWTRWKSGGFTIPMLLHFLHNFIVAKL